MLRFESAVRILVVLSIFFSALPPAPLMASSALRPNLQTDEPTPAAQPPGGTDTPTTAATETATLSPTNTPTPLPSDTPTVPPTDTSVPSPTETTIAPSTETPSATPTASPEVTQTATLTPSVQPPSETPVLTVTATLTATATPTLTPTATLTPTPTLVLPQPGQLGLTLSADPASVTPGDFVTVTLTLSNPGQLQIENLSISTTLPGGLGYFNSLGAIPAHYNPLLQLLTWDVPADWAGQTSLTVGYVAQVAAETAPGAVNLAAEAALLRAEPPGPGLASAQTTLNINPQVVLPTATPFSAGPPARIELGIEPGPGERNGEQRRRWLSVSVLDAEGLAVADDTEVQLSIQGGSLAETRLRTRQGIAMTRLAARPDATVTIVAQAGQAQGSLQWGGGAGANDILAGLGRGGPLYGPAAALAAARNSLRAEGNDWVADNFTRRVVFQTGGFSFTLKGDKDSGRHAALTFRLTDLRVGSTSLLGGPLAQRAHSNWLAYRPASGDWQAIYEVGEAGVEQYFLFEKGLPTEGDLVIEGQFQTSLQPVLISSEEGIRFGRPNDPDEAVLGYGPAVVNDARGREMVAPLELQGRRLRITVPAAWLAQAEFPILIDPLIGPAALVGQSGSGVNNPAVASDGDQFLSVWSWQGDIYGQLVDSAGALSGSLIPISQAAGEQETPDVVYNPVSQEYLVVWNDHRYGFTYNTLRGQRLSNTGQLIGGELELLPPTKTARYPALAVSAGGDYLLVWSDESAGSADNVYGQMLTGSGVLSGTRLTISDATDTQLNPDVAYDGQANLFQVVWSDWRDGSSYDIYGQQVTADGVISGSNQPLAGSGDSQNLNRPAIAANGSGQFLVGWDRTLSSSNNDLQAVRVTAAGAPDGSVLNIDTGSNAERHAAVAGAAGGSYLLLWYDSGEIEAAPVGSDGAVGSVQVLNSTTNGTQSLPAVAYSNGQALAVWTDAGQGGSDYTMLTGRRLADDATPVGNEIFISPYYARREDMAVAPAAGSNAGFLLAWQQAAAAPKADIFVQPLDSQGLASGNPTNLTNQAAAQERPALATGQNGYLVVWQDERDQATTGWDIYGQLLTASSTPTGSLIAVSTAADIQASPAVAYNSQQDEYLVIWEDNRAGNDMDIYGQRFNSSGLPVGSSFGLSVTNRQHEPDVAYNPDQNTYLAVWQDERSSGADDIYGQVISADGSAVGSSFAIAAASNHQLDPVVAYQPASQTYLVAWWDNRNGDYDIYGQIISSTGVLSGSNFAIANPGGTSNDQEYPDVAARSGANEFLLVWQDRRNGFNRDIFGQRVSGTGVLLDEPDTTTADETNPSVNFPFDAGADYTERPAVTYSAAAGLYLAAWNNRSNGSAYTQRYSPTTPVTGTASFTATPTSGAVPLTVTFTDTSSGTIATRDWNFGDGTPPLAGGTGGGISHTYLATGTFTAVLTVTNPGGSAVTSTLITVTEQTTPSLTANFEALDLGTDPTFWLDQFYDTTVRDDFETLWTGETRALGTAYSQNNTLYSHYAIPGWAAWQNYEYTGRLKLTDPAGGIGLAVYSRYPANEQKVYTLRRYAGTPETESFHLVAFGTGLKGDTLLEFTPQANTWYRFRVQAVTLADRVTLRVKVWPEGQAEPALWQADAYDDSAGRSTAGAVGVRTYGPGLKYFDDLVVTPLSLQADFTVSARSGLAPFSPTFSASPLGQVLTYTWNFGDGSALVSSSTPTASHTYPEVGVYTASLTVEGPAGSDTLVRPGYIAATNLNSDLRGYWNLNEASGQRLDSSGYGNHLTDTNTVASASGQVGQAADFERSNSEYLSISHSLQSGLGITGSLTLAGWAKLESLNQEKVLVGKYEYGIPNRAYRLVIRSNNILEFVVSPDGSGSSDYTLGLTNTLSAATWYHLAAVFDAEAQSLALYVNGALAASRAINYSSIYPSTAPFMLGANLNNGNPAQTFDGLLDEWRVYARALSQAEIQELMATTPPAVAFSASPLAGMAPLTVTFSNTTGGSATYLWRFGDPSTGSGQVATSTLINPIHVYTQAGVYTVSLTATGPGGMAILTKTDYISVSSSVLADFSAFPLTGAAPLMVQFFDNSTGATSYAWDFGDGLTSTLPSPTHTYTSAGVYTVSLTADNGQTTDTLTRTNYITVTEPLLANFSATPLTGTVPLTVTFINSSTGAASYVWDFGDNITSTVISPTHTYTQAGIYTVTLAASNGLVTDTLTRTHYITVTAPISREWRLITTTVSPPIVGEQAMAYDSARNRVVLYGGNGSGWPYANATWEFDGTNWLTITTSVSPTARYGAAMAYDNVRGEMILFGGSDANDLALNQTWQYTNSQWSQVAITGTVPPSRTYASLAAGPNGQLYLFGGNSSSPQLYYNDLWRYDNGVWSEVTITGNKPTARTLAALTYDPANNRLLLFGGRSVTGTLLADLWAFDPVAETWTELDDGGGGGGPPARMAHSLTYDPATGNVVLVGGVMDEGDTLLNDTWHYREGWTEATPATTLPGQAYHQAIYGDNAIILFGNGEVWKYE